MVQCTMSNLPTLGHDRSAATALEIARRRGLRIGFYGRVAKEMGVGTMSLYYYSRPRRPDRCDDDALMGEVLLRLCPATGAKA